MPNCFTKFQHQNFVFLMLKAKINLFHCHRGVAHYLPYLPYLMGVWIAQW